MEKVTWEAIHYKDLKNRVDGAKQDYVSALDGWNKAKADAAKDKTKFDKPKPVEGYVKRIGETTIYKTQAEAQDEAKDLTDEDRRSQEGRGGEGGRDRQVAAAPHNPRTSNRPGGGIPGRFCRPTHVQGAGRTTLLEASGTAYRAPTSPAPGGPCRPSRTSSSTPFSIDCALRARVKSPAVATDVFATSWMRSFSLMPALSAGLPSTTDITSSPFSPAYPACFATSGVSCITVMPSSSSVTFASAARISPRQFIDDHLDRLRLSVAEDVELDLRSGLGAGDDRLELHDAQRRLSVHRDDDVLRIDPRAFRRGVRVDLLDDDALARRQVQAPSRARR